MLVVIADNILAQEIVSVQEFIDVQKPAEVKKRSGKGFYLKFGSGYAWGTGKTSGHPNLGLPSLDSTRSSSNTPTGGRSDVTTVKNAPFSLGEGSNFNFRHTRFSF